jgi:hypothetical protein
MRVLVGCESSGRVRDAFAARGHDAWSCDLLPSVNGGQHLQCDVREVLDQGWDFAGFHPPCTYLNSAGLHWNSRGRGTKNTEDAMALVRALLACDIPRFYLENPVGCISTRIRQPDQIIQPYNFGDDASKTTCLWLKNLPPLRPTLYVPPRIVNGRQRWGNQTDTGQNKLPPSKDRWRLRSLTYQGIADAMAEQWDHAMVQQLELLAA